MVCRPFGLYRSSSALPPRNFLRRQSKNCFGENQLLPDSISFSLLTSGHPKVLNNQPVRASSSLSRTFTLPKASSSGFGSILHCLTISNFCLPAVASSEGGDDLFINIKISTYAEASVDKQKFEMVYALLRLGFPMRTYHLGTYTSNAKISRWLILQ